jgi:hypothetical protein
LQRIVKARGSLDAQEAQALRDAKRLAVWRVYGFASLVQYVEQTMGYTTRVAMERLRVANAIEDLPVISSLLDQGTLSLSAAEEITRVATPETEADWVAACHDKPVRDIEKIVSERNKGDRPTDPPDPSLKRYSLHYRVRPETFALERQVKQLLAKELGARVDDDAFMANLFRRVLEGASGERTRAPCQISITTCDVCKRGWQDGGGVTVEMTPAALARAQCDAEHLGRVDAPTPTRARQTVPPALRRQILARDHHRCAFPGCSSHTNLDIHHIDPVENGGPTVPWNLTTLCESHHIANHEGAVRIAGTAPDLTFERIWWRNPHGYVRIPITHVGSG